jgi:hypothetical protein
MKRLFKEFIKYLANTLDFVIVKKKFIKIDKNFKLSDLDLQSSNIIINYKLNKLITTAGMQLGSKNDPYYFALRSSLPVKNKKLFIKNFIKKIKTRVKNPRNASEAIGIKDSRILSKYPEWALVLPWEDLSIKKRYNSFYKIFLSKRKNLKIFYNSCKLKDKKNLIYHDLVWKSHAEQFFNLYKSISKKGFKEYNLVPVHLFKCNNVYRLSLSDDGNHRIRVAYILGMKVVPLKISKIVDLDDINKWKNVKNGIFSKRQAKQIFKNYFNYLGSGSI